MHTSSRHNLIRTNPAKGRYSVCKIGCLSALRASQVWPQVPLKDDHQAI